MIELRDNHVRFVEACVELTQRRVLIESLDGKEYVNEKAKWLMDLRAHQHEFAQELEDQDKHIDLAASVSGLSGSEWIAIYRHYNDDEVSLFRAKSKSFVQDSITSILGSDVDPEDIGSWMKHMSPDDADRVMEAQIKSRDHFAPFDEEWRTFNIDKDEWRVVRCTSRAVWSEDPFMPAYFEGVIMDVTEHIENRKERPKKRPTAQSRDEFAKAMKDVWATYDGSE